MSGQRTAGESRLPLGDLIFATFVVLLPIVLCSSPKIFGDGDVSWHLAAGQWIIDHGRIPNVDPFSYTMGGRPWVAFEWLSECIYAGAFRIAGYPGMAAAVMAAMIALHLINFIFLAKRTEPLAITASFVTMDLILASFLLARPHVLVWPVLAVWTSVLLDCRDKGRAPPLWLALLMLVWANLHGSFVLGFVIAGAIALDALIAHRWNGRAVLGWFNFGLAALILAMLNANGLNGFLHPFRVMSLANLALIDEWQPSTPLSAPIFYAILAVMLGAMLVKRVKLTIGETLLLLFLTAIAFLQFRHQSWLAIVAPLIVAPKFSAPAIEPTTRARTWALRSGFGAVALGVACLLLPRLPAENDGNPRTLIAHIPSDLRTRHGLNGYSFGGPLILAGVPPYIDGRSDMYGDAFVTDYFRMMAGDRGRFEGAVSKYDIAWTMLPPNAGLVAVLDASPNWRRVYADKIGVIHVRRD